MGAAMYAAAAAEDAGAGAEQGAGRRGWPAGSAQG